MPEEGAIPAGKNTTVTKVASGFSPKGPGGQRYLAAGKRLAMRLWTEAVEDGEPAHARDYETVGYVLEGRAELRLEGQLVVLAPGDSWVVPRGSSHEYRVLK